MYIYYVYAYLRGKDSKTAKAGTPYYIGKGQKDRAYNWHGKTPVPKDKTLIVLVEQNLSELGALGLERWLIRWYGRKDLGTGILLNRSDGGEGTSGIIVSEETKKKLTQAKLNITDETRQKYRAAKKGKTYEEIFGPEKAKIMRELKRTQIQTLEMRDKNSKAHIGIKKSIETISKIKIAAKKREEIKRNARLSQKHK